MFGELLIIGAQIIWAVSALFTKKLTDHFSPVMVTAMLTLIGTIVLLPALIYFYKDISQISLQKFTWVLIAGICWIALGELIYIWGLSKTTLSTASLLALTFPLFATTLGVIVLKEAITWKFIVAAALMVISFVLLVI